MIRAVTVGGGWRSWNCLSAAKGSGRTDRRRSPGSGPYNCVLRHFDLNRQGGLAGRGVDGGERSVLQVGVGGVVAGEVAESIAAPDDGGRSSPNRQKPTRGATLRVVGWECSPVELTPFTPAIFNASLYGCSG